MGPATVVLFATVTTEVVLEMRMLVSMIATAALAAAPPAFGWSWPVAGPVLVPFSLGSDPYAAGQHRGIDVGAATGTPVAAPASGAVSFAGTVPRGGKTVTIKTPNGYSVTLVHLGSYSVRRGDAVAEGAIVGTVGPSGAPELPQPYVYLGVRLTADPNGYVDPMLLLPRTEPAPVGPPATNGDPPAPAPPADPPDPPAPKVGVAPPAPPPAAPSPPVPLASAPVHERARVGSPRNVPAGGADTAPRAAEAARARTHERGITSRPVEHTGGVVRAAGRPAKVSPHVPVPAGASRASMPRSRGSLGAEPPRTDAGTAAPLPVAARPPGMRTPVEPLILSVGAAAVLILAFAMWRRRPAAKAARRPARILE